MVFDEVIFDEVAIPHSIASEVFLVVKTVLNVSQK
jgi:hypothetical protein